MSRSGDSGGGQRVALVTSSFPTDAGSMSGIFVARLAEELARRVRLEVVTPAADRGAAEADRAGYRVTRYRYAPRRLQVLAHRPGGIPAALARRSPAVALIPALLAATAVASYRAARRADLVHANWAAIAAVAAPAAARPLVTTLRGSDVARAEVSAPDRWLLRRAVSRSAAVVLVSDSLRRRAAALVPAAAERLAVIPNGIDDAFFAIASGRQERFADPGAPDVPGASGALDWPGASGALDRPGASGLTLVTVGSLVAGKGVDRILRALAALPAPHRLRVLGDGPRRDALESLAADLGVEDRVDFLGAVAPDRVSGELAAADLFVFASDSEGRPNAVIEALAAGLPVVAPRIPAIDEFLDDASAALYPPGDTAALTDLLIHLAAEPGRRAALASAGGEVVRRMELTWADAARRYVELYSRLLADGG